MTIEEEEMAIIRARCEAASAGPWTFTGPENHAQGLVRDERGWHVCDAYDNTSWSEEQCRANAEFIAHARTDVPALLDALAESDAAVANAVEIFEGLVASANNICGHCRAPMSVEDLPAHLRVCERSPLATEMATLRALLTRAREWVEEFATDLEDPDAIDDKNDLLACIDKAVSHG